MNMEPEILLDAKDQVRKVGALRAVDGLNLEAVFTLLAHRGKASLVDR